MSGVYKGNFGIEYVSQQALRFISMFFNEHYNKYFLWDVLQT